MFKERVNSILWWSLLPMVQLHHFVDLSGYPQRSTLWKRPQIGCTTWPPGTAMVTLPGYWFFLASIHPHEGGRAWPSGLRGLPVDIKPQESTNGFRRYLDPLSVSPLRVCGDSIGYTLNPTSGDLTWDRVRRSFDPWLTHLAFDEHI